MTTAIVLSCVVMGYVGWIGTWRERILSVAILLLGYAMGIEK